MTTKKKIILTILLAVLVGVGVYLVYFSISAIITNFNIICIIQDNALNPPVSWEAIKVYVWNIISFVLTLIFVIANIMFYTFYLFKIYKK